MIWVIVVGILWIGCYGMVVLVVCIFVGMVFLVFFENFCFYFGLFVFSLFILVFLRVDGIVIWVRLCCFGLLIGVFVWMMLIILLLVMVGVVVVGLDWIGIDFVLVLFIFIVVFFVMVVLVFLYLFGLNGMFSLVLLVVVLMVILLVVLLIGEFMFGFDLFLSVGGFVV